MADTGARILDGAAEAILREGLAKATVEDFAVAAGVSRATVYRWYPDGHDGVVDALVDREVTAIAEVLLGLLDEAVDLASGLVAMVSWAGAGLAEHQLLQAALDSDPSELAVRLESADRRLVDRLVPGVRDRVAREQPGRRDPDADARWVVAMVLSHVANPGSWDLADPDEVDELVRTVVLGWASPGA